MNSANRIFIILNENNIIYYSAFDYSGSATITPVFDKSFGSTSNRAYHLVPDSALSYLYVAGSVSNKIAFFKFSMGASGTCSYAHTVTNTDATSSNIKMSKIALYESAVNNFFGCAENLGSDAFDLALLYYIEVANLASVTQTWYFDNSI